mgnify:CR=1 FL=1
MNEIIIIGYFDYFSKALKRQEYVFNLKVKLEDNFDAELIEF